MLVKVSLSKCVLVKVSPEVVLLLQLCAMSSQCPNNVQPSDQQSPNKSFSESPRLLTYWFLSALSDAAADADGDAGKSDEDIADVIGDGVLMQLMVDMMMLLIQMLL